MTDKQKNTLNKKVRRNYFIISILLLFVVFGILLCAGKTAFVEGDFWRKEGKKSIRPNIIIEAPRGNIYSFDERLMATNETYYRLYIDFWADGLSKDTLYKYVDGLSLKLSKMFPSKNQAQYRSHILAGWQMRANEEAQLKRGKSVVRKSREYRLLDGEINYLQLKQVRTFPFLSQNKNKSGLIAKERVKRKKPFGTLASRTIGDIYGEFEKGGKNGLELQYDSILRGIPGTSTMRKINGRFIYVSDIEPISGKDIVTTIDIDIQDITEKALLDKLREIDAESGTAVVMEVETGEIKAITNMGRISEGVWAESKNHAVADETEPGSTFKVASMMVALEDGVVRPNDSINVGNGVFMYANARMTDHNWNKGGYGRISAEQAIWYSSNIGVAKIILRGYENNPGKFVEGLYKLGLTETLNLEIPGAGQAKIRSPKDKKNYWSKTTLPWMSFGYETQIPPIYTLTFFNAIANNGKMVKPFFVKQIQQDGKIEKEYKTVVVKDRICSDKTLQCIQEMLLNVVEKGTGVPVKSPYLQIAGKTGTAQISQGAAGYRGTEKSHQVAFCGYFPANKPRYSCIVVIRKPRNGYPSGGLMAGTIFKRVAEEVNARTLVLKPSECLRDSLLTIYPKVKNGSSKQVEYALDKLDIPYKDSTSGQWYYSYLKNDKVILKDRKVIENLVPNVVGMGAKDAVYLLESCGLKVFLSGRGDVKSQTINPGERVAKGQTIGIILD